MRAMVLAAGFGSRLKELTRSVPKCLVPLSDGSTMLERVCLRLKKAGVTHIVINLHYLPDQIKAYVAAKQSFGVQIEFSHEETILGTGGGLKRARSFFSDGQPFLLHNSDVWSTVDLAALYNAHQPGSIATLGVTLRDTKRPLYFNNHLSLLPITAPSGSGDEKPYGFSGIQVIDPKFFMFLDQFEGEFSTIPAFFAAVRAGLPVLGYDMSASFWLDMGSPEKLAELNQYILKQP
jgi:NDP-sugar pyrophosphorylase family protein